MSVGEINARLAVAAEHMHVGDALSEPWEWSQSPWPGWPPSRWIKKLLGDIPYPIPYTYCGTVAFCQEACSDVGFEYDSSASAESNARGALKHVNDGTES